MIILKFKSIFSIDFNFNDHRYQNPIEGDGVGENGVSDQSTSRRFTWTTINSLEYDKTFRRQRTFC